MIAIEVIAYPGYEYHLNLYQIIAHGTQNEKAAAQEAQRKSISEYTRPEWLTMEDRTIPGGDGQDMAIRIYTPTGLPEQLPVIMDVHGGGWMGGNLCATLVLYVRDHGGPELSLVTLNCPVLSMENTFSQKQYPKFTLGASVKRERAERVYLGGLDGNVPSYYAFPGYCSDLDGLPPREFPKWVLTYVS